METAAQNDEEKSENENSITSWSSATNWTINYGSLDIITFESSDSPIDSDTVDTTRKSPLVLKPPSLDSDPCEIKISFAQRHEIRQVYVRSTARVYEIYFAPSLQSSNEYLCTVRCSIAAREEALLHAVDVKNDESAHLKESNAELTEEKSPGESSIGTDEDGWVEVKVPDSSLLGYANCFLTTKTNNRSRSIEDFYEATAEIRDADPCTSLTVRLLSIQSQGRVYVDEIYIFADPIESVESDDQAFLAGNSAGSSLMAMLVPSLLQLSKSSVSQRQDDCGSETREKQVYVANGQKATNIADETQRDKKYSTTEQKDVKLEEVNVATAETPRFEVQADAASREKSSVRNDKVERVLEQLLSRVSRMEQLFSRFEENMLKPINSIDTRLQRVEHQLEVMTKSSQYFGLPSCTRISAPSFSGIQSNSSSCCNDGSGYPHCGVSGSEKEFPSDGVSNPTGDNLILVNACQFLPSLGVSAPKFSNGDDEKDKDVSGLSEGFPQEKPNQALQIDDDLEAALASSVSTALQTSKNSENLSAAVPKSTSEGIGSDEPSMYAKTTHIRAPEFTGDEYDNDDEVASPGNQEEKPTISPNSCVIIGNECIIDSISTSGSSSLAEGVGEAVEAVSDVVHHEGTSEGAVGHHQVKFSCGDDGEDHDIFKLLKDSPVEKPKQALSIDDAIAAALAGFVSTTLQPPKSAETLLVTSPKSTNKETGNDESSTYAQNRSIRAPEFTDEEYDSDDKIVSPSNGDEKFMVHAKSSGIIRSECTDDSITTSNNTSAAEVVTEARKIPSVHPEGTSEGVDGQNQFNEKGVGCTSLGINLGCPLAEANRDLEKIDDDQTLEGINRLQATIVSDFEETVAVFGLQ